MKKIHKLSPLLISKIAAGEVIERPSYAIKELIENAIDAKATEIMVYIEEAGLKKIQVIDNGEGMNEEDLKESWKPHTTSKISNEDELHAIYSLGFRGEALASLAAVSQVTIQSKTKKQSVGFQIVIANGKLIRSSPVGMAPGSIVTAENLFGSVPARKKFLKSSQTELRHIIDTVNYFAVAYPSIKFRLTHNKRVLLEYPVVSDISDRVEQLVGLDTFSFFVPVKKSESYVSLRGYIAKPQLNTSSQNKQFLFVNNRKIIDKLIAQAIKEAFGTMLEATAYPLFVLFVSVPFEMVDVNVHPRKEQVSFVNNQFIFQTVKQLITEILEENNLTFQNLSWKRVGVGMTKSYAGNLLKEQVLDKEALMVDKNIQILQLDKLYIVIPSKNGLVLVDQHAAHERVLFEKLRDEFIKQKNNQSLIKLTQPISLRLTKSEIMLLEEYKEIFTDLGILFVISNKVKNLTRKKISPHKIRRDDIHIYITHLPAFFQDRNPQELLKEILEDIVDEKSLRSIDKVSEEMLAFLACRGAVKAGDKLTDEQMHRILLDLEQTPNNVTCPHGRPTQVVVSIEELHHLFKR